MLKPKFKKEPKAEVDRINSAAGDEMAHGVENSNESAGSLLRLVLRVVVMKL